MATETSLLTAEQLMDYVRDVPDFPKPGIVFKDLSPLLADHSALSTSIAMLADYAGPVDKVVGIEARGFMFGTAVARDLGVGFVPVRKPGKLPSAVEREMYDLEYGSDVLEIHKDSIQPGDDILLIDDVLATGGTAAAAIRLIKRLGGNVVAASFVMELAFLPGRAMLGDVPVHAILTVGGSE